MITIANHPYYKVLGLFMTVFTGKHIYFKEVELFEASTLKITAKNEMNYQVDGQICLHVLYDH